MTMSLKPYRAYKDSGLPWLGRVPADWHPLPLRALTQPKAVRGRPDLPLLSVYRDYGVILRNSRHDNHNPEGADLSTYKVVRPGDLVINKMKAWQGSLGVAEHEGIVSPAYTVCSLRGSILPRFLHLLLRSWPYVSHYNRISFGVRVNQWDMRYDDFKQTILFAPPACDQRAIVRFLDHADRRIRRYIRGRRRLIALLNEQKRAIIERAVTRGLDPNVRLKPSGVEWLGNVPDRWQVAPLKRFATDRCDGPFGSGLKSSHYTSEGVRVIRLQNIGDGQFRDRYAAYISPEHYASLGKHDVRADDLLVAGLGDERIPVGRACVAPDGIEPAMVKADCFRFRLDIGRVLPSFVALQLSATARAASILSTGATRQRVNLEATAGRAIAVPLLHTQQAIVCHLTEVVRPLERMMTALEGQINVMAEYRTRLIADVVTGKLDVREAALGLPEEIAEGEEAPDVEEVEAEEGLAPEEDFDEAE